MYPLGYQVLRMDKIDFAGLTAKDSCTIPENLHSPNFVSPGDLNTNCWSLVFRRKTEWLHEGTEAERRGLRRCREELSGEVFGCVVRN
ncbi:hypothetical protein TIFTF001_013079 [Ficus carica]|uniref:Uncharacterized protein n=1 Tax=Ficus carica TaxID=3494 RepID=A0AA88D5P2_FICCA|nr:hypothetical protein TIFTF001_013079 [Ficus carica]